MSNAVVIVVIGTYIKIVISTLEVTLSKIWDSYVIMTTTALLTDTRRNLPYSFLFNIKDKYHVVVSTPINPPGDVCVNFFSSSLDVWSHESAIMRKKATLFCV